MTIPEISIMDFKILCEIAIKDNDPDYNKTVFLRCPDCDCKCSVNISNSPEGSCDSKYIRAGYCARKRILAMSGVEMKECLRSYVEQFGNDKEDYDALMLYLRLKRTG